MRKKLIALAFALTAAAAALGFVPARPVEAAQCNGILVCCPDGGHCRCCARPCPIQCP